MKSQWYKQKKTAIGLRKSGYSLRMVEKKLNIPRSTLSYWFKNVVLTSEQKEILLKNWRQALDKARLKAVKWHNKQKLIRLETAKSAALETLEKINIKEAGILELALAMLYLGEGFKSKPQTAIGNSNPLILKFFIKILETIYNLDRKKIKCELHLRADQKPNSIKRYWSQQLNIPLANFTSTQVDARTKGSVTYENYKGVCVLQCGNAAIQRKLIYLAEEFCQKIIV